MFKTFFVRKKIGVHWPQMPPVATDLYRPEMKIGPGLNLSKCFERA